jgi:hypothetical protein
MGPYTSVGWVAAAARARKETGSTAAAADIATTLLPRSNKTIPRRSPTAFVATKTIVTLRPKVEPLNVEKTIAM